MIAIEIAPGPVGTYQDSEDGGGRHRSFPTRAFDMYVRGYPDPRRAWPISTRRDDLRLGVGRLGLWHWLLLHHVIRVNVPESCGTVASGRQ